MTFLFTDLEGSTRRREAHPGEMRDALARDDAIVRGTVESHDGVVFPHLAESPHPDRADRPAAGRTDLKVVARLAKREARLRQRGGGARHAW